MIDHPELEISLHEIGDEAYRLELRFRRPDSTAEGLYWPSKALTLPCREAHLGATFDARYGDRLTEALFRDSEVREVFLQALAVSQVSGEPLRVRLLLAPSDRCLHSLAWETVRDPSTGLPLATSQRTIFSRTVGSRDWRPVTVGTLGTLRAVIAVASPQGLDPIDASGEIERARQALGMVHVEPPLTHGSATLETLVERLQEGYDILYLVCHGTFADGEAALWLESANGEAQRLPGAALVSRIAGLPRPPILIVLASCYSAAGAAAALGPALAAAGVPAVLAMHDRISQETVTGFMPVFFRELMRDGEIDRAAAAARAAVQSRDDAWMPVLFLRLRNGRLWEAREPRLAAWLDDLERLQELGQISSSEMRSIISYGLGTNEEPEMVRQKILDCMVGSPETRRRLLLPGDVSWSEVATESLLTRADARRQQILVALRLRRDPVRELIGMSFVLVPPGRSRAGTVNRTPYYLARTPVTESVWSEVMGSGSPGKAEPLRVQVDVHRYRMTRFLNRASSRLGETAYLTIPTLDQLRFAADISAATRPPKHRAKGPVVTAEPASALELQAMTGVAFQLCEGLDGLYWWGGSFRSPECDFEQRPPALRSTSSVDRSPDCSLRPLLHMAD